MFLYASKEISVDEPEFWEKSYLLRIMQNCNLKVDSYAPNYTHDYAPGMSNRRETAEKEFVSTPGSVKGKEQNNRDLVGRGDHRRAEIISSLSAYMKEQNIESDTAGPLPTRTKYENPVITVCRMFLDKNRNSWKPLNLSQKFCLPPLNDECLRKAVFGEKSEVFSGPHGTNYKSGFQFGESEHLHAQHDTELLEVLLPFPTLLPSIKDDISMSKLLPFQKNSTLSSRLLSWIQTVQPRTTPLPMVIMQECLTVYIKKQVDYIGILILWKLMNGWRLMDELAVLRAIYLLGSADGTLLSAPESLVVSISKTHGFDGDEPTNNVTVASTPRKSCTESYGIDSLDSLKFTYKVMAFLLKVKRAKFALDKARRRMWKDKGTVRNNHKRHWLVEQKLLHFVDAFHQYVMDRVHNSAWPELCEGMAAAGSLDEVIEVHETYLLTIHRQCFVAPDKLWAMMASRINSILSLALDFYSLRQTLSSGGAVSAIKARCQMEVDRVEKQFDDCIAFLLRDAKYAFVEIISSIGFPNSKACFQNAAREFSSRVELHFRVFESSRAQQYSSSTRLFYTPRHLPHLADLVTRINYNNFYMSDGGNLMIAPSSESAAARLGRTFSS
ncbi:hypothetical protein F3Y22_tig00111105pilonHSYRG00748 [Hibiscus syriacus]|uniref:Gamma-tubulin complex component n=1 Tax=Hibiscus syriacus TaxID=106335 RepID=A0A6A2Z001_HIBSY|nr:hypothetical protein F3Y22_tig00111105pilonHSYRG00748 [Hibiscus syriacus]